LTKLFTATAFLQQVRLGHVRLDDPVVRIIPEFGGLPRAIDGGQDPFTKQVLPTDSHRAHLLVNPEQVTFRHLLTHTSGLAPWRATYLLHDVPPASPAPLSDPPADRHARVVEAICKSAFVDEPQVHIQYSDLGFILLGEAVQRLTGIPLEEAIRTRLCIPLGMGSVGYRPLLNGVSQTEIAPTEYDFGWRRRRLSGDVDDENACGMGGIAGHAGLFGTAQALTVFGEAWRVNDSRLGLTTEVHREAIQITRDREGEMRRLGWAVGLGAGETTLSKEDEAVIGHTGFTGTSLWIHPEKKLVVACMTNRVFYGRDPQGISAFRTALHALPFV
jgi:CubicO group peptidase (beta-lactamase class C family)